jgi:hypothetical protein
MYSEMGRDGGMVGSGVGRAGLGLVRIMAIIFFLVFALASILIIWEGLHLQSEYKENQSGENVSGRIDRIYTYSIILAIALGLNILTLLWDWSTSSM